MLSNDIEKVSKQGWDISNESPEMKKILAPFDFDKDGHISPNEIMEGAKLYVAAKNKTKKQSKQIYSLLIGYIIMICSIAGLVYGVVKANKDNQVVEVTGMSTTPMLSMDSNPVSINTNELKLTLGVIAFLPFNMLPKITDIVFASPPTDGDGLSIMMMRRVAGIDVMTNVSFTITTTMGDMLVWDSTLMYMPINQMNITLHDGTYYEKRVDCTTCSVINAIWSDDNIVSSYNMYDEFFFGTTNNKTRRRLDDFLNVPEYVSPEEYDIPDYSSTADYEIFDAYTNMKFAEHESAYVC